MELNEIPGSAPRSRPGAVSLGPVPADEPIEITLVLRRRAPLPPEVLAGPPISRDELADSYGADPAEVDQTRDWLTEHGLDPIEIDPPSRRIRARGRAEVVGAAFGVTLQRVRVTDRVSGAPIEHRTTDGPVRLPDSLYGPVAAVLGLDNRPQARSRTRVAAPGQVSTSYTPPQLATIYGMPSGYDGSGQTVAIIELGGGFAQSDLDTYFGGLGIPVPSVRAVGVDGATNQPGQDPTGADGEVLLDIEVTGGIAPKAAQVVYFAPNTDAGFIDAISTAAQAQPTPTAMSISWGQDEDQWTAQSRTAMDNALADAAALGVTVTVAAGDDGSTDRDPSGGVHVDFPASSPHVLGCGGTTLQADPSTGVVSSETVWNGEPTGGATGGGVSDTFPLPSWQADAGVPARVGGGTGRGVPDIAANADPATGYQVYVDGSAQVFGGTSAVAPLWAGLVCRLAQALDTRLGLLATRLYAGVAPGKTSAGLRDITEGNNGAYQAGPGWDACTGLGVPSSALLTTLTSAPALPPTGEAG